MILNILALSSADARHMEGAEQLGENDKEKIIRIVFIQMYNGK